MPEASSNQFQNGDSKNVRMNANGKANSAQTMKDVMRLSDQVCIEPKNK